MTSVDRCVCVCQAGKTPVHIAAMHGQIDIINVLLPSVNVDESDVVKLSSNTLTQQTSCLTEPCTRLSLTLSG